MNKDHGRPRMSKEMGPNLKFLVQKHRHLLSIYDLNMINQKSCVLVSPNVKKDTEEEWWFCVFG